MSREFKFRAWDEQRKKFFTSPLWVEFQVDLKGELTAKNLKAFGKGYQQLKINQNTGLKDKNGKEIYEGDIVRYLDSLEVVKYESPNGEVYGYHFLCDIMDVYEVNIKYSDIEVIGNIYENPEKLK